MARIQLSIKEGTCIQKPRRYTVYQQLAAACPDKALPLHERLCPAPVQYCSFLHLLAIPYIAQGVTANHVLAVNSQLNHLQQVCSRQAPLSCCASFHLLQATLCFERFGLHGTVGSASQFQEPTIHRSLHATRSASRTSQHALAYQTFI